MANLPAVREQESALSPEEERFREQLADLVIAGKDPKEIARQLAPNDRHRRRAIRRRIWKMLAADPDLQRRVSLRAKAILIQGLGPATQRLVDRAANTGRPDVVKLLFEASGFHNPRVKHEHAGEIKISVDMPRPARVDEPEPVDAEVVEE